VQEAVQLGGTLVLAGTPTAGTPGPTPSSAIVDRTELVGLIILIEPIGLPEQSRA
jgi:hypothetical protein